MTIELALCCLLLLVALPVSKSIAAHYLAFALVNLALLGVEFADSSFLSLMFVTLAVVDALLVIAGGRSILLLSAAASSALAIESMIDMDWLLSRATYLSIAVNAAIAACLSKGYGSWTSGK